MTKPPSRQAAFAWFILMTLGASGACAADASNSGKTILEQNCGRCHSLATEARARCRRPPPLREVYLKYPIDQLEEGFAEGMGSKHRDMPQIQFSPSKSRRSCAISAASPASIPPRGRAPSFRERLRLRLFWADIGIVVARIDAAIAVPVAILAAA